MTPLHLLTAGPARRLRRAAYAPLAICALLAAPPATAEPCQVGSRPAATLLLPYFEVDLEAEEGPTTLFSVNNAAAEGVLARLVVWTDWGVPVLGFDVYLGPNRVQPIDLRRVLVEGVLPVSGPPMGEGFPSCDRPLSNPELDAAALASLQAKLTGQPAPEDGLCYGEPRAGTLAVGYLTVDVLNDCSAEIRYPTDEGYFADGGQGVAGNDNVLWGDWFLIDEANDLAQGFDLVAAAADAAFFAENPTPTFYGGAGDSQADNRYPLGWEYRVRFFSGGAFDGGPDLLLWTEGTGLEGAAPQECMLPPPDPMEIRGASALAFTYWNEAGEPRGNGKNVGPVRAWRTPVADLPVDVNFGSLLLGFSKVFTGPVEPPEITVQGWAMPLMTASGRFSVGLNATQNQGFCD